MLMANDERKFPRRATETNRVNATTGSSATRSKFFAKCSQCHEEFWYWVSHVKVRRVHYGRCAECAAKEANIRLRQIGPTLH